MTNHETQEKGGKGQDVSANRAQGGGMKNQLVCAIALTALLVGCAPMIWEKPGATQHDYSRASYECEKDARQSGYYGNGIAGSIEMREFFKRCMISKGYTLKNN